MTAFKEFAIGKFVLRFYKTDHVWTCTVTEDMLDEVKKELALQKLSDISQEIENRESAIHATGYWKGIEYKRMRELTDQEIYKLWVIHCNDDIKDFARAILKKASEK